MVLVGGAALFSDGYNAQIIGYMNPIFTELYPDAFDKTIKTRLSNAFLIGEVFGMLFFGWAIDKLGRRTGIFFATLFLVCTQSVTMQSDLSPSALLSESFWELSVCKA